MRRKRFLIFADSVIPPPVLTYFLIGAVAYPTLARQFYEVPGALFSGFMRVLAEAGAWRRARAWLISGQVLHGFLIAALYPFLTTPTTFNIPLRLEKYNDHKTDQVRNAIRPGSRHCCHCAGI